MPETPGDVLHLNLMVIYEAMHALSYHAQALLDGLLERTADGHHFTDTLHAGTQLVVHAMELGEIPPGNLANHIVKGRLEEGTGCLGDRVLQLEEPITETKFGSNES